MTRFSTTKMSIYLIAVCTILGACFVSVGNPQAHSSSGFKFQVRHFAFKLPRLGTSRTVERRYENTHLVVAASRPISINSTITKEDVKEVSLVGSKVPNNAISLKELAIGRPARLNVQEGEILTAPEIVVVPATLDSTYQTEQQ